jgi:Tfp pilus assembly protein PilE
MKDLKKAKGITLISLIITIILLLILARNNNYFIMEKWDNR